MILRPLFVDKLLGLDLQGDCLRFLLLEKSRRGFVIAATVEKALPGQVFAGGRIQQWPVLETALRQVIVEQGWQGLPVALGLAETFVQRHSLQLPATLVAGEIENMLLKHFTHTVEPMAMDYLLVEKTVDQHTYAVVTTEKNYLDQLLATVAAVGLQVKIVDLNLDAKIRAEQFLEKYKLLNCAPEFYLALGLTLRERPRW